MDLQAGLKELPDRPGVYLFKDAEGTILYVGKALSLKKRVLSYFSRPLAHRLAALVRDTKQMDWMVTGSEAEALLVESSLIKEHRPKFNILLRDDKSYPVLKVTMEEAFPRLFVGRPTTHEPGVKEMGPFTSGSLLKEAFQAIRRIFPFRTCRTLPRRACLDYYLKLCPAPCEGKISQEAYRENLQQVFRLMEGKKADVVKTLEEKMRETSRQRRFEEAAKFRDQISGLSEITLRAKQLVASEALADLYQLLRLPAVPRRIEGFDVSNIFGRQAVGSLVLFVDGKPCKEGYKRFKIQSVSGIDDYAMMREILRRHYKDASSVQRQSVNVKAGRVDTGHGTRPLPDLVVIDGGRGHLNAALGVLDELKLKLPVVGIAKEFEELFLPNRQRALNLPPQSKALQILQRVRDEAHRFAIGYHRLLRGKRALHSALDEIPGVGPRRRQDLLIRFGSVEAMRRVSLEELTQVRGISKMLAQRIHDCLHR